MRDTTTNRRRLLAYAGEIRTLLRMDNWDIVLRSGYTEEEDAWAETWQHDNHTLLNILVSKEFFDQSPRGIRNTIVHELTHAQHRDVKMIWDRACNDMALPLRMAQDEAFLVHMERFVSWITDRIQDSMPLFDPSRPAPKELPQGCYLNEKNG